MVAAELEVYMFGKRLNKYSIKMELNIDLVYIIYGTIGLVSFCTGYLTKKCCCSK